MQSLTLIFIVVFVVGIIYLKIKMPVIKGKVGEKSVATILSFLPKDEYIVINDLMLQNGKYTTQIDHIVVSIYGIFVIETKNYKGWIFGNSYKDYWTQNIWGNKYSLYNPILQNKKHISFLLRKYSLLREKESFIFPIVVFLRVSKLQLTDDCECVLWLKELKSYIRSFTRIIMTHEECHYIASILQSENIEDRKERKAHKTNVYSAINYHENKVKDGICPHCGGRIILRKGKYGNFYGCSNYPRCKYTC